MDKLLEIKIGGGAVRSGWLPLAAMEMVKDLLAAIAEEGPDEEIWRSLDPQIEVVGKASTILAIHTNFATKLRPQVRAFREKARRHTLKPQGRQFVKRHIATPSARWSYVTVVEVPEKKAKGRLSPEKEQVLKFDARYKEQLLLKQSEPVHGFDEIYAVVKRAGGDTPTATLEFLDGGGGTYQIRGRDRRGLAKRIAAHLYETVKLKVEAWWNANTLELDDLAIHDLLDWRDVHLAEVYRENGNRLPLDLNVESVEELIAAREEDRRR
ncbi:MAG TPA: hypothetical protein VEW48_25180 [Thermoanaerobaculia bacterium]|nr:hypothetical protein [Thermoanaerobaculia bacterium]